MKGTAPDLAFIDRALARARQKTAAAIAALSAPRRRRRLQALSLEEVQERRRRKARSLDELKKRKILRDWARDQAIRDNREELMCGHDSDLRRFDALIAGLQAESKATRLQRDARCRHLTAEKYIAVGREFERPEYAKKAKKLKGSRSRGHWGLDQAGAVVCRLLERSGLIKLDPAEGRERSAELFERATPTILEMHGRGYVLHKAVFSEYNVPAASLPFGKEHIFRHFVRVVLEREPDGQVREESLRRFPEIVGALAVQEDPLSSRGDWNVHLNVILVIDPAKCTPLPPEEWREDPKSPGTLKRDPAFDCAGMFSYMKLRRAWGSEQIEIRPMRGTRDEVLSTLKECIKYACKTVNQKSLEKFEAAGAGVQAEIEECGEPVPVLELQIFDPWTDEPAAPRQPAPAMIDWPSARVVEWDDANKGFRRVRSWGCLYRLGKLPEPEGDADAGIRWLGRMWVTPWKVTVQLDFFGAGLSSWFNTGEQVPAVYGSDREQNPPRAGPRGSTDRA